MLTTEAAQTSKKKAAFIDDAFDDINNRDISITNLKEFWSLVIQEHDHPLKALLKEAQLDFEPEDIFSLRENSDDLIKLGKVLWKNRNDEVIKQYVDQTQPFGRKLSQLEEVDSVCQNMENENFEVVRFPSSITSVSKFKEEQFDFIFIDYFLGNPENDLAIKNSVSLAGRIYDSYGEEKKPMTILMSSNPNIKSHKDQYRKDAEMPEGAFRFFPKSDLADAIKAPVIAKTFNKDLSSSLVLQDYVKSLIRASTEAAKAFSEKVTALKIEDYELILSSVLKDEQQPLGSYLAWLYGAHWTNLLQTDPELQSMQKKVDQLIEAEKPVYFEQPSEELAEIYMTALYEVLPYGISYHEWYEKESSIINLPMLQLGDLFTKDSTSSVFMVITPQCDLERPNQSKVGQSILMIPGELKSHELAPGKDETTTGFFYYEKKKFKIFWDTKRVRSIKFEEFFDWANTEGWKRDYRLRLPYALDVQQRFLSDLGRVGLPVTPPFSRKLKIELGLAFPGEKIETKFLAASDEFAFLTKNSQGKFKAWLTIDFALAFKPKLVDEIIRIEQKYQGAEMSKEISDALKNLNNLQNNFEKWFFDTNTEFGLPSPGSKPVAFGNNFTVLLGLKEKSQSFKTLFWISIL